MYCMYNSDPRLLRDMVFTACRHYTDTASSETSQSEINNACKNYTCATHKCLTHHPVCSLNHLSSVYSDGHSPLHSNIKLEIRVPLSK